MTYEEIFNKTKSILDAGDCSGFEGDFAIQVNIEGEGAGIFYIAFKDGALRAEPYDYKGNDAALIVSGEEFLKIAEGKIDAHTAFFEGKLKIDGSVDKALELEKLIGVMKKNQEKKAKPAGKSAKTEKTASKAASKTASKPAAKKGK